MDGDFDGVVSDATVPTNVLVVALFNSLLCFGVVLSGDLNGENVFYFGVDAFGVDLVWKNVLNFGLGDE